MSESRIIVYGTDWCYDCRNARHFLEKNQIEFHWINIDQDKTAEQYVKDVNKGFRSVPTILFPDGSTLVEPSNMQLARKLNIKM